jgi:putative colanic acid biosynthesis acetyltransferase WcaF
MILQGVDSTTGPSFSLSNRILRALWSVVWLCLFRISPRPMHAWRVGLLKLFGAQIGSHFHIHASCRIWAPWQLCVGHHVGVGEGVHFYNMAPITVGDGAVISQGSHLCAGTHDYTSRSFQLQALPITVGAKAWVCTEAFIGPGVTLADGCVLGARAVLTRTPQDGPWHVYAGNPARLIKKRVIRD